jgi:hypothetical protein
MSIYKVIIIYAVKKNTLTLIDAITEAGRGVNAERAKCMSVSSLECRTKC